MVEKILLTALTLIMISLFYYLYKVHMHEKTREPNLFDAVEKNDIELTKDLIQKGADVNQRVVFRGIINTPLKMAYLRNHYELMELLIDNGACDYGDLDKTIPKNLLP